MVNNPVSRPVGRNQCVCSYNLTFM
jgi:hypothetical protein